uniref:Uncharacterized protein n=1 Tax=Cuerna arida TaxID=1464854 RepID=A0A1B6FD41_9HEMI
MLSLVIGSQPPTLLDLARLVGTLLGCSVVLAYPMAGGPMPDPYAYGTYASMGGPDPYAYAAYGGPDPFASPFASAGAMPFQRTGPQPSPYGPDPFGQPSYSYSF